MSRAPLKLGPPVEGPEYFLREACEAQAWSLLGTGHDLLLLDPRRVGKTSFLRRLASVAKQPTAVLSVESSTSEIQIITELYKAAAEASPVVARRMGGGLLAKLRERILKVGAFGVEVELDALAKKEGWATLAEELMAALTEGGEALILLDELPMALRRIAGLSASGEASESAEGIRRVESFLAWLRHVRQRRGGRVRWVFAGSIGLDTLTRRWGLGDHIQDLRLMRLGALDDAEAVRFVRWAAERLGVSPTAAESEAVVRAVGWPIPYHLGLVMQELADRRGAFGAADVDAALGALLVRDRRTHFDPWDQRLDRQFNTTQARLARQLLQAASRDERGVSVPHLRLAGAPDFAFVTDALCHDGYLVEAARRLQFRSPLLRQWWKRHGSKT